MKLLLNKIDAVACSLCLSSIIKAAAPKEPSLKENSLEYKVLAENKNVLEKVKYAEAILNGGLKEEHEIELNRSEAKVLIATMIHTAAIQAKVMSQYEKCAATDPKFSEEIGRRKEDYVRRLKDRAQEVNDVLIKLRKAL